ncbi:MAG: nitrile hydratase accessory protein [Paracoccaceae bacterium]
MKRPDDALAPRGEAFQEAWHAQTLATAHGLEQAGAFTKTAWAETLGAALKRAEGRGAPDTEETYYLAALEALEALAPLSQTELDARKKAWEEAYRRTAHGDPVTL